MVAQANSPAGPFPAARRLFSDICQTSKQVAVGFVLSLNVMFSYFVLLVAILCAAWLSLTAGTKPDLNLSTANAQLVWLCGCVIAAGFYIHMGVLARNWVLLTAVAASGCGALWIYAGTSICWVPALLLVGAMLSEIVARLCLRWRLALLSKRRRVPNGLVRLFKTLKVAVATTAALCVMNIAALAASGISDVQKLHPPAQESQRQHCWPHATPVDVVYEVARCPANFSTNAA